jgi:prevent-host-death family protein
LKSKREIEPGYSQTWRGEGAKGEEAWPRARRFNRKPRHYHYHLHMRFTLEQAKFELEALIARSAAGEEVLITRNGKPVAQVVPAPHSSAGTNGTAPTASTGPASEPRRPGWGKNIITHIAPDFDEPLEDFREYMK